MVGAVVLDHTGKVPGESREHLSDHAGSGGVDCDEFGGCGYGESDTVSGKLNGEIQIW